MKQAEFVPLTIGFGDREALESYFSWGVVSAKVGPIATVGEQLERVRLYRVGSKKCRRCRGSGFVDVVPGHHSAGIRAKELAALIDLYEDEVPPAFEALCPNCRGHGVVQTHARTRTRRRPGEPEPIPVNYSSGALKGGTSPPELPDVGGLTEWRRVHVRAQMLKRRHPELFEALADYLGQSAFPRWSLKRVWGHTPAGKKLVGNREMGVQSYFAALEEDQRRSGDLAMERLFAEMDSQALELLEQISKRWRGISLEARNRRGGAA